MESFVLQKVFQSSLAKFGIWEYSCVTSQHFCDSIVFNKRPSVYFVKTLVVPDTIVQKPYSILIPLFSFFFLFFIFVFLIHKIFFQLLKLRNYISIFSILLLLYSWIIIDSALYWLGKLMLFMNKLIIEVYLVFPSFIHWFSIFRGEFNFPDAAQLFLFFMYNKLF